ncbi:MAG: DUF348 domain-containing protein [Streptosporangiales bacterium]|nr:DUF348 domain-containing protein [Streptosporangiales bacterium]
MRRSPAILAAFAALVTLLVGATTAFVFLDKNVRLTVDGQTRTVHSFASDVRSMLEGEGVKLGPKDIVAPSPDTRLERGDTVVVRHARQLSLTVDGKKKDLWVTALTVGEALDQLRLDGEGAMLSASRDRALPREGFALNMRSPKKVSILIDRVRLQAETPAPTVRELLAETGIRLGKHDRVSPGMDRVPYDGMVIKVFKLLSKPKVKYSKIAPRVIKKENPKMTIGETKVLRKGRYGIKQTVYAYMARGGRKVLAVIASTVKRRPVSRVVEVGTKQPSMGDADSLNWAALAECESGGNPRAVNSAGGYYGLYQFSLQTWGSVGGSGLPSEASPDEQTMRAKMLYNKVQGRWQGQWPVCGKHLFD